ncbi:hypothetical protein [Rhodopirellula bahusiensis]|nr:hypothetical protein [Rhodopirellula bahusiensis]
MTTASKNTDPSRRSNPSQADMDATAPTLLRLPDLCPPADSDESYIEEASVSKEPEDGGQSSMQELLDVAMEATDDAVGQASVTRLPDLAPPQIDLSPPAAPVSAFAIRDAATPAAVATSPVDQTPSSTATKVAESEPTGSASKRSWKESSETLSNRVLGVVGSRNTLLVLLAVIACWAVFAPRRHPNAQQNSEALTAKEPDADRSAAKKGDPTPFESIAAGKTISRPKNPSGIRKAADSIAASESVAANSKPRAARGTSGQSIAATAPNAPKQSVGTSTLGQPSATNSMGAVPGGTSLVESQLASSTMQHGVGGAAPFDSVPFHFEAPAETASQSVRKPQMEEVSTEAGMTIDALAANYGAGLPAETTAALNEPTEPDATQEAIAGNEPAGAVATQENTPLESGPAADDAPPAIPVPLQTGTPGPILNWIDYLPPMPSEMGEQASSATTEPTDAGLSVPENSEEVASEYDFPSTQSPGTPDFRFGLPGDGPEGSVGTQTPPAGDQPNARVAAPPTYPDFNLRR